MISTVSGARIRTRRFRGVGTVIAWLMMILASGTASARANGLVWGVNGHPFTAYPGIPYATQLDLVRELGARSYRVNVSSLDHVERLRDLIALGARRGIEILPVLTPPVDLETTAPETLYANSFNFAFVIASAIRRHVDVVELGNELENYAIIKPCETQSDGRIYSCSHGLGTGIATTDYEGARWKKVSAVLKGLSDGTIAAAPSMRKAMGSAGWGHTGVFSLMQSDGIRWDISVWHAYQTDPTDILQKVASFNKPIWITEFNHPIKLGMDPGMHARKLQEMLAALKPRIKRFNIQAVHIYELLDEPYWGADTEAIMGLVHVNRSDGGKGWEVGQKKPSFDVVKAAISEPAPAVSRDCDLSDFRAAPGLRSTETAVSFAYCLVLGRAPEPQAAESWTTVLASGRPVTDLIVALSKTDEFQSRYPGANASNRDFLYLAFDLLLGRRPDGGGLESYLNALSQGSMRRQDIIRGIVTSSEFTTRHNAVLSMRLEAQ